MIRPRLFSARALRYFVADIDDGPVTEQRAMTDSFRNAVAAALDRIVELAAEDVELRGALRQAADACLSETQRARLCRSLLTVLGAADAPAPPVAEPTPSRPDPAPRVIETPPPDVLPVHEALSRLTLGSAAATDPPAGEATPPSETWDGARTAASRFVPDEELPLITERCRIKADTVRWLVETAGRNGSGEADREDFIARAKSVPNCYLWMLYLGSPDAATRSLFEDLAGAYDAAAEASQLLHLLAPDADLLPEAIPQALELAAEAQSALRTAVRAIKPEFDVDQDHLYNWLKRTGAERHVYIPRHMRVDDPADPAHCRDLVERLRGVGEQLGALRERRKRRKRLWNNLRYVSTQLQQSDGSADYLWTKLIGIVNELVEGGEPPSSRDIRDCLLPIVDMMPDLDSDLPGTAELVLRELDAYLVARPIVDASTSRAPQWSPETRRVAQLVAGRSVVLIGGLRRRPQEDALKAAFRLTDLIWVSAPEHTSIERFAPAVADPDVALVLLAIRWSSHSYGEVKVFCDQHGKPLVRLPGGYHPNQVAAQILAQCSDRLSAGAAR